MIWHHKGTRVIAPVPSLSDISVRVRRTAVQSILNNTQTAIIFQAEDYDTNAFWAAGLPTRLVIPFTRKYALSGQNNWAVNATGIRRGFWRLNGVTVMGISTHQAVGVAGVGTSYPVYEEHLFNAGDFLELMVQQTSGIALDIQATGNFGAIHALPMQ